MPLYKNDSFAPAGNPPAPTGRNPVAAALDKTSIGQKLRSAGLTIEDLLVPKSKAGQAVALAGSLIPGASLLGYGKELPLVGRGLEAASQLGEARFTPALARLGLLTGAGVLGAKEEGKSALSGAATGLAGGATGEALGILTNPEMYSRAAESKFGNFVTDTLGNLPGMISDIKAGKNPIIALREMWPEARAVYGRSMDAISEELGGLPLFKDPKKGWVDFDTYKAKINALNQAGYTQGNKPRDGLTAKAARAERARLTKYLQKRLDELSEWQPGVASPTPQPNAGAGLPTVSSQVPSPLRGPTVTPADQTSPALTRPPKFAHVGDMYRNANRQYEKAKILSEFANHEELLGRRRFNPTNAQKIMRDKMLIRLKDKLSPTEFTNMRDAIFFGAPKGTAELSGPGMAQRVGSPSLYGGGSSFRARIPIPSHEKPDISQYVGYGPLSSKMLRLLGTLLGIGGEQKLEQNLQGSH